MRFKVRRMGRSSGVVLPGALLAELGVDAGGSFDAELVDGRLVLIPVPTHPRAGWAAASEQIAAAGDDALVWPEFGNADDTTLTW